MRASKGGFYYFGGNVVVFVSLAFQQRISIVDDLKFFEDLSRD